jgi:hypothetical protein
MLWAITSYFNPSGYTTRLANYRRFRAELNVPLITVEASVDGRFQLEQKDAEILVQRTAHDVLWQKERLLNVALEFLPADCREVAWIDCDVVFNRKDWPEQVRVALESHSLIQLFSERCNLGQRRASEPDGGGEFVVQAIAASIAAGRAAPEDLRDPDAPVTRGVTAGLAWAASRESLDGHGFYDACILGSGDRVMLCAAVGEPGYAEGALQMTTRHAEHYRAWAKRFSAAMSGGVGSIDGQIFHLWHGDLRDRNYAKRYEGLRRFCFDPFKDLTLDRAGCWRWSSPKRAMHEYVRTYFESRREDGRGGDLVPIPNWPPELSGRSRSPVE